jgi:hypothetical protein
MGQKRKQLQSSIQLLEMDLQATQVKWQRFQTLRKSGAVSGEDMLTAELNVKRTEIQLRQQRELIEGGRRARFAGMLTALTSENVPAARCRYFVKAGPAYFINSPFGPTAQPMAGVAKPTVLTGVRSSTFQVRPASTEYPEPASPAATKPAGTPGTGTTTDM